MARIKGTPKFRYVPREVTDADIEALLRLTHKWDARLTVKRGGSVIIKAASNG